MQVEFVKDYMAHRYIKSVFLLSALFLLWGCTSLQNPDVVQDDLLPARNPDVVQDKNSAMLPALKVRPENLLFPDYLLMDDFEFEQQSRISGTTLIGVDMSSGLDIKTVMKNLNRVLVTMGWSMTKVEVESQSFLMESVHLGEHLEIRAVQGTGPTQIFILYNPVQ